MNCRENQWSEKYCICPYIRAICIRQVINKWSHWIPPFSTSIIRYTWNTANPKALTVGGMCWKFCHELDERQSEIKLQTIFFTVGQVFNTCYIQIVYRNLKDRLSCDGFHVKLFICVNEQGQSKQSGTLSISNPSLLCWCPLTNLISPSGHQQNRNKNHSNKLRGKQNKTSHIIFTDDTNTNRNNVDRKGHPKVALVSPCVVSNNPPAFQPWSSSYAVSVSTVTVSSRCLFCLYPACPTLALTRPASLTFGVKLGPA